MAFYRPELLSPVAITLIVLELSARLQAFCLSILGFFAIGAFFFVNALGAPDT